MSEAELVWLATQARQRDLIVEFGSLHGRSTRALADNNNGVIWAVDPWSGSYLTESGSEVANLNTFVMPYFIRNLRDHIDTGRVIPVRDYSYNFNSPFLVDMVFLDGDHRYKTVVRDIEKAFEMLKPNGLICGHDYGHPLWPGVKKAVDELVKDFKLEGQIWFKIKS